MKNKDVLESMLAEVAEALPEVKNVLIDERDRYLAQKIKSAPGNKIVAVVGAGHVPGIKKHWDEETDLASLEAVPPKGKLLAGLKWGLPLLIIALIVVGFFRSGQSAGTEMITWWIMANAIFAGLGATLALSHPFTICSAVVAAPFTSLNPMIAAGWVSGLVELFLRKPKVRDFETLPLDLSHFRGFWKNGITRVLLVVVLTNLGSAVGTFVAIPFMLTAFH
jgi:pheromone shutdown-related protein TraB